MNILALEFSTTHCSIAAASKDKIIAEKTWIETERSSRMVFHNLQEILQEISMSPDTFDCFIAGIGPGIFSGLRIAVSTAYGMALANDKKVYGINSAWSVVHHNVYKGVKNTKIIVCGDARRNHFWYVSLIIKENRIQETKPCFVWPCDKWPDDLPNDATIMSSDWDKIGAQIKRIAPKTIKTTYPAVFPAASASIAIAQHSFRNGDTLPPPLPIYLHPPVRYELLSNSKGM